MNSSAKLARSEATRMSANSASSMPQPTLGPFTAAMTGLSQSGAAIAAGVARRGAVADSAGRRSPVSGRASPILPVARTAAARL